MDLLNSSAALEKVPAETISLPLPPFNMFRALLLSLVFLLVLGARVAHAEERAPTLDEARAAFLRGRELMSASKWSEAGDEFLLAAQVKNTPGLRYYVGFCREKEGRLVEALDSYQEAADLLAVSPAPDVEQLVPEAQKRLLAEVPQLLLKNFPKGGTLYLDGQVTRMEERLRIDPGSHEIHVTAGGFEDFLVRMEFRRATTEMVTVEMKPIPAPVEVRPVLVQEEVVERPEQDTARTVVFWGGASLGALGVGATIAGAVLFASGKSQENEIGAALDAETGGSLSACASPDTTLSAACSELEAAVSKRRTGTAVLVGGAAAVALGATAAVVAKYFWPDDEGENAALQVNVGPIKKGAYLSFSHAF